MAKMKEVKSKAPKTPAAPAQFYIGPATGVKVMVIAPNAIPKQVTAR